jgi:hypothetical protein
MQLFYLSKVKLAKAAFRVAATAGVLTLYKDRLDTPRQKRKSCRGRKQTRATRLNPI